MRSWDDHDRKQVHEKYGDTGRSPVYDPSPGLSSFVSTCGFKDRQRHAGCYKKRNTLRQTVSRPFLTASSFQGYSALNRKENSFPDLHR